MSGDVHVRFCERLGVRLPRATHLVLLAPRRPEREWAWLHQLMTRLGLTLHPEKTRMVDARHTPVACLGHAHRWRWGRLYLDISPKTLQRIRAAVRHRTTNTTASLPTTSAELTRYIQGARHYVRRVRRRRLSTLDYFVGVRVARWWARTHGARRPAWSLVAGEALSRTHRLERWNLPASCRPADARFAR